MPTITPATDALAVGPGYVYWAPLGTALPTNTVVGSVFTDVWAAAWLPLGWTDAGSQFSYQLATGTIDAAEFLDPLRVVTTGRTVQFSFALGQINMANIKRALNGGTITVTGATTTTLSDYTPPDLGAEIRAMIGWESTDSTERAVYTQCLQTGNVQITRAKGTAKALIPCQWSLEQPTTGKIFHHYTAGVTRA
jgi:hypothetical protein